jgi:hypothetical protein
MRRQGSTAQIPFGFLRIRQVREVERLMRETLTM